MEKEITLLLVIFLSTSLGLWYVLLNQDWAASKNQLFVSVLLSPSILVITWAISNDLALSLGMIGALSIVRFRNPVKNPAELSIYFVYIVIGVAGSVYYQYAIAIWGIALVTPFIVSVLSKIKPIGNATRSDSTGLVAHFQTEGNLKNIIGSVKLDKNQILSLHENLSGEKPQTHISILVNNQTEFLNIAEEFKNCGKLSSSNLQQSF